MDCIYTLEWLDTLITVFLNPAKTDVDSIKPEQILYIKTRIEEEKIQYQSFLKNQVFSLLDEHKIEVLIKQYYSALILILDQALQNESYVLFKKNSSIKEIQISLIKLLEELLSFIETRFLHYISSEQRVPATYLLVAKEELKVKVGSLKPKLEKQVKNRTLTDIVFNTLNTFLSLSNNIPVTLREILYMKDLVKKLEELSEHENNSCGSSRLNAVLIYMNFNSQNYIDHFTDAITEKLSFIEDTSCKLEQLLLLMKEFKQMNYKSGVALNLEERDLEIVIDNWFSQEIHYLERQLNLPNISSKYSIQQKDLSNESFKVMCALTVDQISLLLRAADESRVIIARSLNAVFKQIAPHLSTSHKINISSDSMRSKSYAAETKDKEIVIQILEKMIRKIREY